MRKKLSRSNADIPAGLFTGEPHLEMYGGSQCVVDGLESVLEYSAQQIKLAVGKKKVTFHGDDLHIDSFTPQGAVVEGMIVSVDFSNAD